MTSRYPRDELYGLTSQSRAAAVSIPSNIAEGCGRGGRREFTRFLRISAGSASELEYQLLLARELAYVEEAEYLSLNVRVGEVKRMLAWLMKRVKQSEAPRGSVRQVSVTRKLRTDN